MIQQFTFQGIPRAQGRPKFYRRGNFTGAYDPKNSREYKDNVAAQIVAQKPKLIERDKGIKVKLFFYLPRPKGHYNAKGDIRSRYEHIKHTSKPDLDNLIKAIKDSLKGIVWHDDSQVTELEAIKRYSQQGRVTMFIEDLL